MKLRALLATMVLVAGASQLSCKVNDYCLECLHQDGGNGGGDGPDANDGGTDASDASNCVPTGPEICDGKDNDCNGLIDDGVLPGVGTACANQIGECAGGIQQCIATTPGDPSTDHLSCSKNPSPEICDGKDNDCNGLTDEGDPGGGGMCGNGVGECKKGVNHCIGGMVQCMGAIGPTPEVCDGKDNDCDGAFDEDLTNLGVCGVSNVGLCTLGQLGCFGGGVACDTDPVMPGVQPPVLPAFEICDGKDNDCDGVIDNGFDFNTDPQNCGGCNMVCGAGLPNGGNAVWTCGGGLSMAPPGMCAIASCKAGWHDNNNDPSDGCEFGVCFITGVEVCDGVDNDCDGIVDEDLGAPPAICATQGACAGTAPTCDEMGLGHAEWVCHYAPPVSTQVLPTPDNSIIIPETLCDGIDNDCNGEIDDHQGQVAHADGTAANPLACNDGNEGVCRGTGVYQCDDGTFAGSTPGGNLNGPALCNIMVPGGTPQAESCNNLDDNCDGVIDNSSHCSITLTACSLPADCTGLGNTCVPDGANYVNTGKLIGQDWIAIGNGKQMMQYEVSKPDATATGIGAVNSTVCSQPGVIPWTNVTYPQALAACQSIGASLCSEQQWHRTCSVIAPTTYPLAVSGTAGVETKIEAEDYSSIGFATGGGTTRSWAEDYESGFSGISDMLSQPNNGGSIAIGNAAAQSPWLNFQIAFPAAATYHVFVRMFSTSATDNTVFVGINTLAPPQTPTNTIATSANTAWQWRDAGAFNVPAAGTRNVTIYMGTDGVRVDAIVIENGNTTTPSNVTLNPVGNIWAYATTPNTYQPTTCNGHDEDPATDATLPTGSLASCYAAVDAADHAFDMSGNVKEWTLAHQPGQNPIRGGASNNDNIGIDCPLNFTLADDTFFFTNVGFRCCR